MANVFDVAVYILNHHDGPMSAMKLEKLVYYSQAWSLVWDDTPLFSEPIEAWISGPVIPTLFDKHRGLFQVTPALFESFTSPEGLNDVQIDTINVVIQSYAQFNAQVLSEITHSEPPWKDARKDLDPNTRGHAQITDEAMSEYYSSIYS